MIYASAKCIPFVVNFSCLHSPQVNNNSSSKATT